MGRRRSRAEWSTLIAKYKSSGVSAQAFARELGVHERTVRWWVWELSKTPEFVELAPSSDEAVVELRNGRVLKVPLDVDGRVLTNLAAALDPL